MTTEGRLEAAAKAYVDTFYEEDSGMKPDRTDHYLMTEVLAASDAHDLAHGVARLRVDDEAVERAAKGIYAMNCDPITWDWKSMEHHRQSCINMARAVINALKEEA